MAGRKSKTATVDKPKASQKNKAPSVAKGGAVSKRSAKPRGKASGEIGSKTLNQVVIAAESIKRKTKASSAVRPAGNSKLVRTKGNTAIDVYAELERLAAYIDAARREIAQIRPQDVKEEYLSGATDQLDAVVEATADATNAIMDCCDEIHDVMGDVSAAVGAKLTNTTTRIYEACTFQDITGQRIGKVVTALKNIEARIDALVLTFGDEVVKSQKKAAAPKSAKKKKMTDADLLEGPQLSGRAKNQAEIDDLLARFD